MQEFLNIFNTHIKREGADALLDYLRKSDFFVAPASAKFHLAQKGGLCLHSVNVYKRLKKLLESEFGDYTKIYSEETVAVVALLHDVCKTNYYTTEMRNVKNPNTGVWESVPFYRVNEKFPFGHGEKSVFIVNQYIKLSPEEAIAINWHMGGFDERVLGGSYSASEAFFKYNLALFVHIADMQASYLDEERG